jgi:Flp pilus assembly protein TadG
MMIAWKKFCRVLSAFKADRRANVAITFAFASLPILGFVAAAVDYSRANSVKAAMQTALDSTALMLAKEAATDTEDQLKANALKYFTAVFARPEAKDILVNVSYTTAGGSKIVVNATAAMDAEFTKLLGYDTFHINASSTAKWGTRRLRVALVLDNTGSMADAGKMAALKTATKGLLSQLQGAVTQPGDVYVSIVPFVKDVNLGASNWNANWIYWGSSTQDPGETDNTSWEALHGTCDSNSTYNNDRNRCRTRGGVCSNTSFTRQSTCTTNGTCSVGARRRKAPAKAGAPAASGAAQPKPHVIRRGLAVSPATRPRPAARTPGYATYPASRRKAPAKTHVIARSAAGAPELSARTTAAPGCPVSGPRPPDRGPPRLGPLRPSPRISGRRAPGRLRTTIRGTAA